MTGEVRYQFGEFSVDPMTRTLSKGDELRTTEPRVFDVLVYLLAHRSRVVTRQELLDRVWGSKQSTITEGVVTRTVMKARRLIGDDADEPSTIRTVHRVGYRFVAPVEEVEILQSPPTNGAPLPARPQHDRVAVLPFRDETGSPDLAWIDLGLMSMTIEALASSNPDAGVVPTADLLAVVGGHDPQLDLEAAATKIATALGATDVVQATLSKDAKGELTLAYVGTGLHLATLRGSLKGFDPVELCQLLAQAIQERRRAAEHSLQQPDGMLPHENSRDTRFARMAHARALQAIHTERWGLARKLLRVALDVVPGDLSVELDYCRCLVSQRDPRAGTQLESALQNARAAGNAALELRALHYLAMHRHICGDLSTAEQLLSEALHIAESLADREAELQLLLSIGQTLACEGRPAVASWMLDRAGKLAKALENQVALARLLDIRGRIATFSGDPHAAIQAYTDAALLSEQFGLNSAASFSVAHRGMCLLDAGRMSDAAECFAQAFRYACRSANESAIGLAGCYATRYGGRRRPDIPHAHATIEQMQQAAAPPEYIDLARAIVAGWQGQLEQCAALLDSSDQAHSSSPSFAYHVGKHRVRVLVCLGLLEEASDLCDELRTRASGRLKRPILGSSLHMRGLIARADGSDASALDYLLKSLDEFPPSAERADAALDAAWLCLESGDQEGAIRLLAGLGDFVPASLEYEYGPTLLVQARLLFEQDDAKAASALQARYCELLACLPHSDAGRCLSVYRRSAKSSRGVRVARIGALPSLFELVPGMGFDR